MLQRLLIVAACALHFAVGTAQAQGTFPGVLNPGQFLGNSQAVPAPAQPVTMSGDCVYNSSYIIVCTKTNGVTFYTGLSSPVNPTDAATKAYVDAAAAAGLVTHTSVILGTAAALPANTYNNGTSGVGATMTENANGALTIDGTAVSTSQRVLVKNESTAANNGIYVVTQTGSGGAPYILTRATDANSPGTGNPSEIGFGTYVLVTTGTANAATGWAVNSTVSTIGTSAINWAQFSAGIGVASVNSQTGAVNIVAGSNISVASGGGNVTITGAPILPSGGRLSPVSGVAVPEVNVSTTGTMFDVCDGKHLGVEPVPNGTGNPWLSVPIGSSGGGNLCNLSITIDSTHHKFGTTTISSAYILGDNLTVVTAAANTISKNDIITCSGCPTGIQILSQSSGTAGGAGVYVITNGHSSLTGTMSGTTLFMTAYVYGDGTNYMPVIGHVLSGSGVSGTPAITGYGAFPGTFSMSASESVASPTTVTGVLTIGSSGSPVSMTATGQNSFGVYLFNSGGVAHGCVSPQPWRSGTRSGLTINYTLGFGNVESVHITNGPWANAAQLAHCWDNNTDYGPLAADTARLKGSVMTSADGQFTYTPKPAPTNGGAPAIIGLANIDSPIWVDAVSTDSASGSPWNSFSIGNPIPCNFTGSGTNGGQNYQIRWTDPVGEAQARFFINGGAVSSGLTANADAAATTEVTMNFIPFGDSSANPTGYGQWAAKPVAGAVQNQGGSIPAWAFPFSGIGSNFAQCEEGSINVSYNVGSFLTTNGGLYH